MDKNIYFKLKFAFLERDEEKGKVIKSKCEMIAQSINYTSAEILAQKIINDNSMMKEGACTYEIIKLKTSEISILYNDTMKYDDDIQCGLIEHYFEDEDGNLYEIKIKTKGMDDEKGIVHIYYVPSTSMSKAIGYLKEFIERYSLANNGYTILNSKIDNSESVFVSIENHKNMLESSL